MSGESHRKPLLCRLHHKWARWFNRDGEDYLHCTACGKDRYDVERRPRGSPHGLLIASQAWSTRT